MRLGRMPLLLFLLAPLAGCLTSSSARPKHESTASTAFLGPAGPDVIQMNVAVLQFGVGETYVNEELWALADEQLIPSDRKALLRENGFRVGQIRGITPPGLQAMLTSQRNNPDPRLKQVRAGEAWALDVGPSLQQCRFQLRGDGRPSQMEMPNAQMSLEVTPSLTPEGNVCLQFKPQVGPSGLPAQRSSNLPLWMVLTQRPTRKFDNLCWEVTLQPNEYVVVGCDLNQTESMGLRTFVNLEGSNPVQRLLVIRTARALPELPIDDLSRPREETESLKQSPPLALQAAWSSVRGDLPKNR